MNVANLPVAEPTPISTSKKQYKQPQKRSSTSFDSYVDDSSRPTERKNSENVGISAESTSGDSTKEKTKSTKTENTVIENYMSSANNNTEMADFLYNYQRSNAESHFLSPNYATPEGFDNVAHPSIEQEFATINTVEQLNQNQIPNLSAMMPKQSEVPTDISELGLSTPIVNSLDEQEELAEKIVIPIPPALNFLTLSSNM